MYSARAIPRLLLVTSLLILSASSTALAQNKPDQDLDSLLSWFDGNFSSKRHSQYDSSYLDIDLHMKRIWTDRTDGAWFYVEQALATAPEKPYRQRVYRVRRVEEGMFESVVYTLPDPDAAIGAWKDPERLGDLTPEMLRQRRGCEVYLQATGVSFTGSTHGTACRSDINGASYTTSEVVIMPDRIVSWDRGFNAANEQVWGAQNGGYHFFRE